MTDIARAIMKLAKTGPTLSILLSIGLNKLLPYTLSLTRFVVLLFII